MDLLSLKPRLEALTPDVKVWHDDRGLARLAIGDSSMTAGMAHWAPRVDDSLAAVVRVSDGGGIRLVYFVAREFDEQQGPLACVLAEPLTSIEHRFLGDAEAQHARLVEQGRNAVLMAACVAHRRWRRSNLYPGKSSATIVQGAGTAAARLVIEARPDATVQLVGSLGGCTLFTTAATLETAPAVAVRAIEALDAGVVLGAREDVEAQRAEQAAIVAGCDLIDHAHGECLACHLERQQQQEEVNKDASANANVN